MTENLHFGEKTDPTPHATHALLLTNTNNNMRRKNPHPQRAVNARTVLKVSYLDARDKEEEEVEEEEEQPTPVLCLKIPDEDEVVFEVEQKEIRKETTTTKRGKRKRGHECDVCEKVFVSFIQFGSDTCVSTRTRNRTSVMCARRVFVNLVI